MNMIKSLCEDIITELKKPDIQIPVKKLYELYFEAIISQILASGGSRDDGADIFQEAILILIDKIKTGKFREESSVKTFLTGIAKNLWLHELRTRSRRNQREINYSAFADEKTDSGLYFNGSENTDEVPKLMDKIGSPCREILTGYYYDNQSMKEMLNRFNYENEQVLRNRKSRCLKKIKEMIASDGKLLQTLKSTLLYE
jgi:RNA polymerase sigma factor (sigma-70 family)